MLNLKCIPGKDYIAYIDGFGESIFIDVIDLKTQEIVSGKRVPASLEFVQKIPILFDKSIKAVILNIFLSSSSAFSNNLEFCKAIRKAFDEINLLYLFVSDTCYVFTASLINENIVSKLDETITFIGIFSCSFAINNCKFTKAGYEIISYKTLIYDEKDGVDALYEKILQSSNSSKIVATAPLSNGLPIFKVLKEKVLKMPNFITSELGGTRKSAPKFACEIYKWLIDNSYVKYHIIPTSTRYYFLQTFSGGKFNNGKFLFGSDTILPHQITFNLPRWNLGFHITYVNETEEDRTILQKLELGTDCHYHKITILVDINNFPTIRCESLLSEHILNLPQKLTQIISEKYPVIIFRDLISLICIFNPQKNQYEFLDTWNGIYGRDLFISFDEKKPKYFEKAAEVFKLKPTFVVYDLLCILSIPPNELQAIKCPSHWGFTVTKDINNPILLEFDDYNAPKTAATPILLMAMLLKQHIKAITKKTGTKPKQLACCYFDLKGDKNLVFNSVGEALKLLKIDATEEIREFL
uniref:Uncharacterized protein n=1 Tax=Panagrolaimus davidi TaxID=227884 RepID=A0A914QWQ4_9BILA